jgi:hypothetical protein
MAASELDLVKEIRSETANPLFHEKEVPPLPAGFIVYPELRLVHVVVGEMLTVQQLTGYVAALRQDPRFEPDFSEIVDLTGVEEITITAEEAMALADQIDPYSMTARRAFVTRTPQQLHVARMHQLLQGDNCNIQIFSSMAEAIAWIENGK